MYIHTYIDMCVYTYMYMYIYICMYIYIYIYTHVFIHCLSRNVSKSVAKGHGKETMFRPDLDGPPSNACYTLFKVEFLKAVTQIKCHHTLR